jgi:outer membrane protein TolC
MNHRTLAPVVAALLMGLTAVQPARGDEPPPPLPPAPSPTPPPAPPPADGPAAAGSPVPGVPGTQVLHLTLADALRYGAARNLELIAGAYDPAIASDRLTEAWGSFDTLLTAGVNTGHVETPSSSTFTGSDVTLDNTVGTDVRAERRLKNGSTLALLFHADRLFTTNSSSTVNPRWFQTVAVEWTQPLLRGAGDAALNDVRRAQSGTRVAEHDLLALTDAVLLRIETAYWDLAFLTEQVAARFKAQDVAQGLLDLTQARVEQKVAATIELAEARAGLEERRGDRILVEGLRDQAEDVLRALILPFDREGGRGIRLVVSDDPRVYAATERLPDPDENRWVAMAMRRRPDLLSSQAGLEILGIDVRSASDELKPQLDLVARLSSDGLDGGFGSTLEETLSGQGVSATLGVNFSVYVGRKSAKARLRIAQWIERQAAVRQRDLENRIVADVRAALREYVTARSRQTTAAAEATAASDSLEGERAKEKSGESTPFRVLEREEVRTRAVTREGRAAADARIGLARLWKAVGVLSEMRGVRPPPCGVEERR